MHKLMNLNMDQEVKKVKISSSKLCSVCLNSSDAGDSAGDFIGCQKCDVWIHKICFGLRGNLLEIFDDFEVRGEEFPFPVLCTGCRQFTEKPEDKLVEYFEVGTTNIRKNPFEVDCILQVILEHMNIQDLTNIRLVNKLWNESASRILSKDTRQNQIKAYNINVDKRSIYGQFSDKCEELEKCFKILKDSNQKKLFRKLVIWLDHIEKDRKGFKVLNEMVQLSNPTNVSLQNINLDLQFDSKLSNLFLTFLTSISENVVNLYLFFEFNHIKPFDQTKFSMPKFSKLKSLSICSTSSGNSCFVKNVIKNSPNLLSLRLYHAKTNYEIEDLIRESSDHCILSEESAIRLQELEISETSFNFESFFPQMKLKTLSLHPREIRSTRNLHFGKLKTFLASQNETLETLKIYFKIDRFISRRINNESDSDEDFVDDNELEIAQMDLPRLDNVTNFFLAFDFQDDKIKFYSDTYIWPVKPIKLSDKLPNLKRITISYCQSWALSFIKLRESCPGVSELVLDNWTDGNLKILVKLFPNLEILNLKYPSNQREKIFISLEHLDKWSASLKRIEITCDSENLEDFDFEKFACLTNLESIKISQENSFNIISRFFINPNFEPLFKIPTLSQVVIKNFKISKDIIDELREKYPSLDYSYYPKYY